MNKLKFLIIVIIGLLVSNGILFFTLIKENSDNDGPKKIIIDKLHFDKAQINNYEEFIQQHRQAIDENEAIMNQLRSNLFEQLKYQQDTSKIDSLISIIAKQQYIAEKINYNHFLEIKRLCKPSQIKDFDELTNEIENFFSEKERE